MPFLILLVLLIGVGAAVINAQKKPKGNQYLEDAERLRQEEARRKWEEEEHKRQQAWEQSQTQPPMDPEAFPVFVGQAPSGCWICPDCDTESSYGTNICKVCGFRK